MKRRLSKKVEWDPESIRLELLDWESRPEDFDQLYAHVMEKLRAEFLAHQIEIRLLASEPELRSEVLDAAKSFSEKYVSLPSHVYWHMKAFLLSRQKGTRWR